MKHWGRLEIFFFGAFLFWSAAGLIFTIFRVTPFEVASWPLPSGLILFVQLCLLTGDPILIFLAFANTHLNAARQWTPQIARRWMIIILCCSFAVETLGALTGFPFGTYHYTARFGPLLGVVPLTIPFAWYVVVTNALFLVRLAAPYVSRPKETVFAALLCTAYDFILEPFATTSKHYWDWKGISVPWTNYAAWLVISGLLVWFFAPTSASRFRFDPRPWVIYALTILIFLVGR